LAATAQAIDGTLCVGLSLAVVTLVSGLFYARIGGAAFLIMAALCLLALPACEPRDFWYLNVLLLQRCALYQASQRIDNVDVAQHDGPDSRRICCGRNKPSVTTP
jgi:hypothetical protein